MNSYEKQARDFLEKTGAKMEIIFLRSGKYFHDDKEVRDIYGVTITRNKRSYSFEFGQSLNDSGFKIITGADKTIKLDVPDKERAKLMGSNDALMGWIRFNVKFDLGASDTIKKPEQPNAYDILACLQKYDVGSFEDFCWEFGYDTDSRKAGQTYRAVANEYENLCRLFSDEEMEMMGEIS
jgi:hypothetical protein